MSEPKTVARKIVEVVPGVWHWRIHDERIDFVSAAHAVQTTGGVVLVDPLPVESRELTKVGEVTAIVLTCGSHGRSAWRLRDELGVPVHVPALSETLRARTDATYSDGDELPGGLRAVFTPGAGTTQHTLLLRDPAVAFIPDLLARDEGGDLSLVPAEYMADPLDSVLELAEKRPRGGTDLEAKQPAEAGRSCPPLAELSRVLGRSRSRRRRYRQVVREPCLRRHRS